MAKVNLLSRFKKKLVQQDLSEVTIKGYLNDIDYFFRWLKTMYKKTIDIKKITSADLKAYRQEMVNLKRQKASSVNRRLQALKRFFAWSLQIKLIRNDPSIDVRFVRRKPATQPMALTKDEVHALLRVAGQSPHGLSKRNYAILQLMLQAGLRVGEVVLLQYQDIELKERSGQVRIAHGKGFKEREIPLNATVRRALSHYFKSRDKLKPQDPAIVTKQGSYPTVRAIQLMVSGLAQRAKVDRIKVSAHTLRHTFATNYLKANPNGLIELATLLGHESLNTTAIYTKASKEKLAHDIEQSEINIYDDD